ncbi:MAG: hypothetical protein LBG98_03725, partial [Puniceicoccales bacterium]|nr:hypothetical protein [Puniceicoccales bacterium]
MGYTLKVLSGPHQGVEVDMGGSLVVGSSSDCGLVLADSLLQAQHFSFQLKGEEVWVHPIAGKVFIDGCIVKEDMLAKVFQFITVGTTHFVFGPSEGQWPEISLKDAPLLMESSENAREEVPEASAETESSLDQTEQNSRKKIFIVSILLTGLFFIGAVFIIYHQISPLAVLQKKITASSAVQIVRSELELLGWKDEIYIKTSQDGKISIKGYVPTNADLAALKEKIRIIDGDIPMKVYSVEKILQQGSEILTMAKIKVKLRELQLGSFVVEGYAFNPEQWDKIRARLLVEVSGLKDLQDRVYTPVKVLTTGRIVLTKSKLIGSVGIFPKEDVIVVSGTIAQSEKDRWEDARLEMLKTFTEAVPLQFFVTMAIAESGIDGNGTRHYFEDEILSIVMKSNG